MSSFKIMGTGSALPSRVISSEYFDEYFQKPQGWVKKKLGIQTRYFAAVEENSLTLAKTAMDKALERAQINIQDVGCIIGASGTMHQHIPYNAALYQSLYPELNGLNECFDVNMTCLSFVKAFSLAQHLLAEHKYVMIVSSEIASVGLNYQEIESTSIFGDGAAVVILSRGEYEFLGAHFKTFAQGHDSCEIQAGGSNLHPSRIDQFKIENYHFNMNGRKLFKIVKNHIKDFNNEFEEKLGLPLKEFDWLIPHQASRNSMEGVRRWMNYDKSKFYNIFESYGNQIAASIPFALNHAIEQGDLKRGQRVLLMGTSAGVSIGGVAFEY